MHQLIPSMTLTTDLSPDYRVGTWTLDPSHSEVGFSVRHLMISTVRGTFEKFDVTIVTPENPADATITATIDVASVNTKSEPRDNHLRASDFFLVETYPTMTFVSTAVSGAPEKFTVTGALTLRGVTKTVDLVGQFGGVMTDGYGQTKAGATLSTVMNRQDFGVNWNAALEAGGMTLGDDVTITLDIQVVLQP